MRLLLLVPMVGCASASAAPAEPSPPPRHALSSEQALRDLAPGTFTAYRLDNTPYAIEVNSEQLEFDGLVYTRVSTGRYRGVLDCSSDFCLFDHGGAVVSTIEVTADTLRRTIVSYFPCGEDDTARSPLVSTYRLQEVPEAERCQPGTYTFRHEAGDSLPIELEVPCDGTIGLRLQEDDFYFDSTILWLSTLDGMTYEGEDELSTRQGQIRVSARVRWERGTKALEVLAWDAVEASHPERVNGAYRRVKRLE